MLRRSDNLLRRVRDPIPGNDRVRHSDPRGLTRRDLWLVVTLHEKRMRLFFLKSVRNNSERETSTLSQQQLKNKLIKYILS